MKEGDAVTVIHRKSGSAGLYTLRARVIKTFNDGTALVRVSSGGLQRLQPEDENTTWIKGFTGDTFDIIEAARRLLA